MNRLSKWTATVSAAMVVGLQAMGQAAPAQAAVQASAARRAIVVSIEDRKLAILEDGQVKKVYTVAVGKASTPSPVGTFTVVRRVKNPVYQHDGKTVEPGPHNPVGTRWMGLSLKGYGIHGTNEPKSIGKAASHGCIRMAKADLEEMYEIVSVGDTVELIGQRNEETAELFGQQKPAAAESPVVAASTTSEQPVITASAMQSPEPAPAAAAAGSGAADGVSVTGTW